MQLIISGNYTLVVDPSWRSQPLESIRLLCNTAIGPVNVTLPKVSDLQGFWNPKIFIVDHSNNASVNNITILPAPASGDTIDGAPSSIINTNKASAEVQVADDNNWMSFESNPASSGNFSVEINRGAPFGKTLSVVAYGGVVNPALTTWTFFKDMFTGTNYPTAVPPTKIQILPATVNGGLRNGIVSPTVLIDEPPLPAPDWVNIMQGMICAKVTSTDGRVAFAYFNVYYYPSG